MNIANDCKALSPVRFGLFGVQPRCALPKGHDGPHETTYGRRFDEKGEVQ